MKSISRREYLREYQRRWVKKRRDAWVAANGPCALCASDENLEVDHVEPARKSLSVGTIWSRAAEVRSRELAKCQVLCHACHAQKTSSERHGAHTKNRRWSDKIVRTIRSRAAEGESLRAISSDLGVPYHTVKDINCGRKYVGV